MKKIEIEELKQLQLEILKDVHLFCRNNNITYYIAYGTLLGAVRHRGYIPWDDDIDIMMPRDDYVKFLKSFNGASSYLTVCAPEVNRSYYASYANVFDNRTILVEPHLSHRGVDLGVKIDVFPLDVVPDDETEYKRIVKNVALWNKFLGAKRNKLSKTKVRYRWKHFLLFLISLPFTYAYLQKKVMEKASSLRGIETKYLDNLVYNIYPYKRFEKEWFGEAVDVEFEGLKFNAPSNYDSYLRRLYGDYMQLPPVEKRVTHHDFDAYWK